MTFFRAFVRTSLQRSARLGGIPASIKSVLLTSAVLLFSAAHSFGQGTPTGDQPTTVHGIVINSVTQAPIARALVYSTDERFGMLTDSEGHFEFNLPKPESQNGPVIFSDPGGQFYGPRLSFAARKPGFLEEGPVLISYPRARRPGTPFTPGRS